MKFKKKLIKLIKDPKLFFSDRKKNLLEKETYFKLIEEVKETNKTPIFGFRIHHWKKSFFESICPDNKFIYFPFNLTENDFNKKWSDIIISNKNSQLLIWGLPCPEYILSFANKHNIKVVYVEDGFIRSIDLGANHSLPLSLNFDKKTLYFNANKESDLEYILNNYNFKDDQNLIQKSIRMQKRLLENGISKYNHAKEMDLVKIYGNKTKKRILVIGQVEDDASIIYGCNNQLSNNDLVRVAAKENPDAQIIYKPHPDVLLNKRKALSNPKEVENISLIIYDSIPIDQALNTIDHVYTITSQVGFEALLRNIPVTTLGCPFYSGWGLTIDRQKNTRRKRVINLNEMFAAAYILYPKYYHFISKSQIDAEEALELLIEIKNKK